MQWLKLWAVFVILLSGCGGSSSSKRVPVASGATIEFYAVSSAAGPGTRAVVDPSTKSTLHLVLPAITDTADVATVSKFDMEHPSSSPHVPSTFEPALEVILNPTGASKMKAATTPPVHSRIAILINGKVVSAPSIMGTIGGTFILTGDSHSPLYLKSISAVTGMP